MGWTNPPHLPYTTPEAALGSLPSVALSSAQVDNAKLLPSQHQSGKPKGRVNNPHIMSDQIARRLNAISVVRYYAFPWTSPGKRGHLTVAVAQDVGVGFIAFVL